MKKLSIAAFAILFGVISCTKKETNNIAQESDSTATTENVDYDTMDIKVNCYLATSGKDSVFLRVQDNLGTLVGTLSYKNFEKDSSSGEVLGTSSGDTLKLNYEFTAEGQKSEREIWFLKKDNGLLEGIGDYDATGTKYANPKKVQYGDGHKFESQPCKD